MGQIWPTYLKNELLVQNRFEQCQNVLFFLKGFKHKRLGLRLVIFLFLPGLPSKVRM